MYITPDAHSALSQAQFAAVKRLEAVGLPCSGGHATQFLDALFCGLSSSLNHVLAAQQVELAAQQAEIQKLQGQLQKLVRRRWLRPPAGRCYTATNVSFH